MGAFARTRFRSSQHDAAIMTGKQGHTSGKLTTAWYLLAHSSLINRRAPRWRCGLAVLAASLVLGLVGCGGASSGSTSAPSGIVVGGNVVNFAPATTAFQFALCAPVSKQAAQPICV